MGNLLIGEQVLTPFTIDAKPLFENYISMLEVDISDYTFAANFIWVANSSGFYAEINNCFALFTMTGGEMTMLLPPIGKQEDIPDAMVACFEIMNANNSSVYYGRIDYVPTAMLESFVQNVDEAENMFELLENYLVEKKLVDYVYDADALIELKGNSYHTKRTEINKFKRNYEDFRIEPLDVHKHHADIMKLFNKWVADRVRYMPKEEVEYFLEGIHQERYAVERMLKYFDQLDLIGLVIYINDELKGFTAGEKINESTASVIIEKTDFEVMGCAQFIFREFCKLLKEHYEVSYINVGDDMGFENLRKVKMSYRPYKLIPKYTIYQK